MNNNYIKHSNWLLGLGIFVAIVLIIGSIWMNIGTEDPVNAGNNSPKTELGQSIKSITTFTFRVLSGTIKQIL